MFLLDFIAPRHCAVCGKRISGSQHVVCATCLLSLRISEYYSASPGNALERTFWHKLPIERAAAFITYDHNDTQHQIVLDLKYHNQPRIGYHLGRLMSHQLKEKHFFDGIDTIVPIPIPFIRKMRRGYNQSEQLARGISRATGLPVCTRAIRRLPYKTSQTRLTAAERTENVRHTFRLRHADRLKGKHILLVDDVITTGSTIRACGHTLSQIPGIRISVLSLAVSRHLIRNIRNTNPETDTNPEAGSKL